MLQGGQQPQQGPSKVGSKLGAGDISQNESFGGGSGGSSGGGNTSFGPRAEFAKGLSVAGAQAPQSGGYGVTPFMRDPRRNGNNFGYFMQDLGQQDYVMGYGPDGQPAKYNRGLY